MKMVALAQRSIVRTGTCLLILCLFLHNNLKETVNNAELGFGKNMGGEDERRIVESILAADVVSTPDAQLERIETRHDAIVKAEEPILSGPPYRIVQVGQQRSGSTFQFQLLASLVSLKTRDSHQEPPYIHYKIKFKEKKWLGILLAKNRSFVIKTHSNDNQTLQTIDKLQERGSNITVFSSSASGGATKFISQSVYNQQKEDLVNCSLCEVDKYEKLFDLNEEEVEQVKHHMSLYQVIRRCCGFQMSFYEVLRLNGCDMTKYRHLPDYPHCEKENLTNVELQFDATSIPFREPNPQYSWSKPGDCARMNGKIASGKGFNRMEFAGCDAYKPFRDREFGVSSTKKLQR